MRESVKHRLIGAAVLTAVAVLFLPSFFKDRQQYQVDTGSHIPGRPSITAVDFNEPEQPEGIEPAPAPETMFVPADPEDIVPADDKDLDDEKTVAVSTPSSSPIVVTSSSAASMASNDSMLPEGWVIQVASLSAQEGANKLRDQLQAEGHRAYVRAVPLANNTIYRVFIGPKQSKAEVMSVKTQVDSRLKINSLVLPFKP